LQKVLSQEIQELSQKTTGLHFNATHATSDALYDSFMDVAATKMADKGPTLWKMFGTLLNLDSSRRRISRKNLEKDREPRVLARSEKERKWGRLQKEDKRRLRAIERNESLVVIKQVVCISIVLQSNNEHCNYLQSILGLFFHSATVPEKVVKTLSHSGLSISTTSINRMIKSLSTEATRKIRATAQTLKAAFAYNNFNQSFKVAAPTIERPSTFVSATSATLIPLYNGREEKLLNLNAMLCSEKLWAKNPRNPFPTEPLDTRTVYDLLNKLHMNAPTIVCQGECLFKFDQRFAFHICEILIHQAGGLFSNYKKCNTEPTPVNQIPLHQSIQVPCRAMKIKESTNDGNVQVIKNLLRQGGLAEPEDD
ncbi:hypothetical protein FA15DRAFT_565080, partial [Coprinopsis marcescibilis]